MGAAGEADGGEGRHGDARGNHRSIGFRPPGMSGSKVALKRNLCNYESVPLLIIMTDFLGGGLGDWIDVL